MDEHGSFVVHLIGSDDDKPFKHFRTHQDAVVYGRPLVQAGEAERAEIYFVMDATDAATAVAAVRLGRGKLLYVLSPHASEVQIEAHKEQVVSEALKAGPDAFLNLLGLLPK